MAYLLRTLAIAYLALAVHASERITAPVNVTLNQPIAMQPQNFTVTFSAHGTNSSLVVKHDRILHVVVLGQDLDTFTHVHPEDFGFDAATGAPSTASFPLALTFPGAGKYLLAMDAAAMDGTELASNHPVTVTGLPRLSTFNASRVGPQNVLVSSVSLEAPQPFVQLSTLIVDRSIMTLSNMSSAASSNYHVQLAGPSGAACVANKDMNYTFTVTHAASMEPVMDLQLYLGAAMHLSVFNQNLTFAAHLHGEAAGAVMMMGGAGGAHTASDMAGDNTVNSISDSEMSRFGPNVHVLASFPNPGLYALIGQLRRGNDLILAPFFVECASNASTIASLSPNAHNTGPSGMEGHSMNISSACVFDTALAFLTCFVAVVFGWCIL